MIIPTIKAQVSDDPEAKDPHSTYQNEIEADADRWKIQCRKTHFDGVFTDGKRWSDKCD